MTSLQPIARRREQGFTLVELIVAVAIQALIIAALGMAFIGILRGTKHVNDSLARSGDARIAANYIISDARNSSGPETSLTDTASCPDASPPVAGTPSPVVRFNWDSTSSAGATTSNTINYVLVGNTLLRRVCKNGTLMSDRAVASNIQSVAVTCSPTANCSGSPTTINAAVTAVAASDGSTYLYTLKGAFRKLNGTGPPVSAGPSQSFILLGAAGSCGTGATGITASGSGNMKVYGNAYINTTDGSTCKAMSLSNSGVFTAGKTWMLQGGSCTWSGGSSCPPLTSYSPAIVDPYATALSAPTTSGMPIQTGCSGPQATQTASPGFYSGGFTLGGGNTCTLASGVYVIDGGFNISNGGVLKTGAGGVLIYLRTGAFAVSGGASVTLTGLDSGYSGVVVWQAATNTSTISLSNGGALVFNGVIYAPKAKLDISGNAETPIVTGLVVQTVVLTNSGGITVGSPLSITAPTSLPAGEVNVPYPSTLASGSGGGGAYTWSATGLPAGMSIDPVSGTISGTPTATLSNGTVTIFLNDAAGDTADSQAFTLTINPAPTISTTSPITGGDVTFAYSKTLAVTGGTSPFTWSATGLPGGLTMSTAGVISGTPTATGTFTIAATVNDALNGSATKNLAITINSAPSIATTSPLPTGEKTVAYSATVTATGGATPYVWSSSTLPAGLGIASGTGVISGTPTVNGTFTPTIVMTDATGAQVTKNLSMTINPQPSISSVVLANKAGGVAGTIEQGDTITVTFSTTMSVSSFCSTWSNNANDQVLNADNLVTVNVSNANPDVVTITTASGCTFNLGTINLAGNNYTSVAATFKGTGTGKSTINWTAAQNKMVIVLGAKATGTLGAGGSTSPTYTANAAIRDAQNAALGSSTFTLSPAAVRF